MAVLLFLFMTSIGIAASQDVCDNRAILSRLNALEQEVEMLREEQRIQKETATAEDDSLFMATFSGYQNAVSGRNPIEWNYAPINPGGYFDTGTGTYTAPHHGYYQFTVTKRSNNYDALFRLEIENKQYTFSGALFGNSDPEPEQSNTITVELQAGDHVRVLNSGAATVLFATTSEGIVRSWFTGHMLVKL